MGNAIPQPHDPALVPWLKEQMGTSGFRIFLQYLEHLEEDLTALALRREGTEYDKGLAAGIKKVRMLPTHLTSDLRITNVQNADDTKDTSA